jgi:hypothetical protein
MNVYGHELRKGGGRKQKNKGLAPRKNQTALFAAVEK